MKRGTWVRAAALGLVLGCSAALAQTQSQSPTDTPTTPTPSPGYGMGMMHGYAHGGPGTVGGYGAGMMHGYGARMMGGCPGMAGAGAGGYGAGMMGGYGRGMGHGPGMMGGYGPGMMGGYGPGWGRGYGAVAALDLTAEQQDKIGRIAEDTRAKNWATMGELRAEQFKLRELYHADKPDANAIAEQQGRVDTLRRTLLKSRIEAHNQMASVLTEEQRAQLRETGSWWLDE